MKAPIAKLKETKPSLVKRIWEKILDQWVIGGILAVVVGVAVFVYEVMLDRMKTNVGKFIELSIIENIDDISSPLHTKLTDFISAEIQGTIGASTKQSFELGPQHAVYYVPTYIPKDHSVLIFVDFSQVGNAAEPTHVLFAIEGISQLIATDQPKTYEPDNLIEKAREIRANATASLFAPPSSSLGVLDKIAPDVFTIQFQLRPEDLQKEIAIKLIVFVVNPIWVRNQPKS